jgi:hypothetical protein
VTALIFYTRSSRRHPNKGLRRRFEHQPVESKCTGTSAGNYTITVTATAGSRANTVRHTAELTLVVQ